MANIKLGGTTAITESSGALTIASSTLTTPTIANMANCTFPAGHVLQMKGATYDPTGSTSVSTAAFPFGANLEVSMTCSSTSNFLRLEVSIPDILTTVNANGLFNGWFYSTDSFSTNTTLRVGGGDWTGTYAFYKNTGDTWLNQYTSFYYCPVPTTSAIKIRPYFKQSGGTIKFNDNHSAGDINTLIVTEVQG